jgi:NADPH:quinone reductase-like Zn-dependent oxidoreductase
VEIAIQSGASVTALVNSAESEKDLAPLKPDHVSHSVEDLNGPYDLVLDSVGGTVLEWALATVSPAGVVVPFGNISGQKTSFNAFGFVGHEGARIQSFLSYAAGPEEAIGADLSLLARLVQKGLLHPRIGLQVDWNDIKEALTVLSGNRLRGKAVFIMS